MINTYDRIWFTSQIFLGSDQLEKIVDNPRYTVTREGAIFTIAHDGEAWEVPASNVRCARRAPDKAAPAKTRG